MPVLQLILPISVLRKWERAQGKMVKNGHFSTAAPPTQQLWAAHCSLVSIDWLIKNDHLTITQSCSLPYVDGHNSQSNWVTNVGCSLDARSIFKNGYNRPTLSSKTVFAMSNMVWTIDESVMYTVFFVPFWKVGNAGSLPIMDIGMNRKICICTAAPVRRLLFI